MDLQGVFEIYSNALPDHAIIINDHVLGAEIRQCLAGYTKDFLKTFWNAVYRQRMQYAYRLTRKAIDEYIAERGPFPSQFEDGVPLPGLPGLYEKLQKYGLR